MWLHGDVTQTLPPVVPLLLQHMRDVLLYELVPEMEAIAPGHPTSPHGSEGKEVVEKCHRRKHPHEHLIEVGEDS